MFCEVILPLHLPQSFTYRIPQELCEYVKVGCRVAVQFGKKKIYSGIISELHNRVPNAYSVKFILDLLDCEPILSQENLTFWQWIADYYACYIGDVMTAALPVAFRLKSETKLLISPEFSGCADNLSEEELKVLDYIDKKKSVDIDSISKILKLNSTISTINKLLNKQILIADEQLFDKYSPKLEDYLVFGERCQTDAELKKRIAELENSKSAKNQLDVLLRFISDYKKNGFVKRIDFQQRNNALINSLKTLIKKDILAIERLAYSRLKETNSKYSSDEIKLNSEQANAYKIITDSWNERPISLLHGVTGSGKTEVYIKLIAKALEEGKQVLYLLPEIALSTHLLNRLEKYFGSKVGVYHSRFSKDERVEIWNKVKDNDFDKSYRVIIGSRASIFLPFTDLGLIIVDEEHDSGFKQTEPSPRYNAKDAALYLAHTKGTKVVLGSATPSVESFFNAEIGRFNYVQLTKRYTESKLPDIQLIDLKECYKQNRMYSIFSEPLLVAIENALKEKSQVILFKNLRGFASSIRCEVCGWTAKCPNCDVSLTVHKHTSVLNCHYCGNNMPIPNECPQCHSHSLRMFGNGSEKIEEEIKKYFPNANVARMDLDTTKNKDSYKKIIDDFESGKTDILCGTQIISKGFDFDNVGLVGVIDIDNMLNFPDFRAYERSFSLLTQIAGRSGRSGKKGKAIIQTFNPYHKVFKDVCNNDYRAMYENQIVERKLFHYPPFYRLVKISLQSKSSKDLDDFAKLYSEKIRMIFGGRILGPEYPPISKIRNLYIKNIILKLERTASYEKAKKEIMQLNEEILATHPSKQFRIITDIDPQ